MRKGDAFARANEFVAVMEVFEDGSLTDSSEIQSNSALPVKKAPLTPTQVSVHYCDSTKVQTGKFGCIWLCEPSACCCVFCLGDLLLNRRLKSLA